MSEDDIERMVHEAEEHADEDKTRRELIDKRNHADALIHSTEKSLGEHGEALSDEEKQAIEDAIGELRGVLESEDAAEIEAKTNALQEASMKLGEAMYKSAQAEAEGGDDFSTADADASEAADEDSDETVVDADFEEVQDDKKSGD